MKWIFLLRQETSLNSDPTFYDFVPYKYGPFSFTVYRDLEDLGRYGYLAGEETSIQPGLLPKATEAFRSLPSTTQEIVNSVLERYARFTQNQLVETVYAKYPWFASRSESSSAPQEPNNTRPAAYTAGYAGKSIDFFLQKLLKSGIDRIIDVRNNPISRKYGFSKGTLARLSSNIGIDYIHIPALGVPSSDRRSLKTFEDYKELMQHYEYSILPKVPQARLEAATLLGERPSVLLCFEADWRCCHRGRLAEALSTDSGLETVHL